MDLSRSDQVPNWGTLGDEGAKRAKIEQANVASVCHQGRFQQVLEGLKKLHLLEKKIMDPLTRERKASGSCSLSKS